MTNVQSPLDYPEPPDPALTNKIVTHLKSQGIFDQFRRECMADVDTKPAYQNLRQRVEGSVAAFLRQNPWRPDMNKNQMRDNLRKHIQSGGFLDLGVDRIVDQVVNPKIYTVFLPKVEEVFKSCVEMDQGKPKFVPPAKPDITPGPISFQNKHNLAPRSKLPAPLSGPMRATLPTIETFKTPEPLPEKDVNLGSPNAEDSSNENYMVDEDDTEGTAEDDEESPPFEPNSETDRLILGVRTDSSDSNSNEDEVVTTIVDDNLEDIIDNDDLGVRENAEDNDEDKKDDVEDESSSDEYVPKTPTINVEGSDGSMIELNTISEYKQYQTKFDEESFGNVVEEIVSSQWEIENGEIIKEEKNRTEGEFAESPQKRKIINDSFDDYSNSSVDKGDTSDDGKIATFSCIMKKKIKVEDVVEDEESEITSGNVINESYDSNTDRSMDIPDASLKSENDFQEYVKGNNSKDTDRYKINQCDENNFIYERHNTNSFKSENDETHERSERRKKEKDKSKRESHSHKHSEKGSIKPKDKNSEDTNRSDKYDKKDKGREKNHEHRHTSRDFDKDKKLHQFNDVEGRKHHDSSHNHDKDNRNRSKSHSHSSSKHTSKSTSEKNKRHKDHAYKETTEKHRSHDKRSEKHKHESRKKSRESCKSRDKEERRRSTDRDSNGPCGRSYMPNTSTVSNRSTPSRNNTESSEAGERTTSNSDNTVSDNIETQCDDSTTVIHSIDQSIASSDFETSNESANTSNQSSLELTDSTVDDSEPNINLSPFQSFKEVQNIVLGSNSIGDIHESNDALQEKEDVAVIQSEVLYENIHLDKDEDPSSSPEKENRKKDENTVHIDRTSNNIGKEVKFRKPKIAANIFEVRKIMKKRRHMERKRLKFLMDNSSETCLPAKTQLEDESNKSDVVHDFDGFEEASSNKVALYHCLINKLTEDLKNSEENNNKSDVFTTSWMDIDPSLDDYLINVLNAQVYRKARVLLPQISEEYYKFDDVQNVYVLIKLDSEPTRENIDSNQSPVLDNSYINSITENNANIIKSCDNQINDDDDSCDISLDSPQNVENIKLNNNKDIINLESLHDSKQLQVKNLLEDHSNLDKGKSPSLKEPLTTQSIKANDVTASKPVFSITFNQTYDEILKERLQKSTIEAETIDKYVDTPRTVMKITKNEKSEQVILKTIRSNSLNVERETPRITRAVPTVNDKIPKPVNQRKQIPFISQVNKPKNTHVSSSQTLKSQKLNGNVSPDSTSNLEVTMEKSISKNLINDIIGIQDSTGETFDNDSQSGDDLREKNYRRQGTRQQRYDSSDLYKPRPQLSTRRGRGRPTEGISPVNAFIGQKRSAVASETNTPSKRKR